MPDFKSIEFDNTAKLAPQMLENNGSAQWQIINKIISSGERLVKRTSKFPNLRDDVMNHIVSSWEHCNFSTHIKVQLHDRATCGDLDNLDVLVCTLKLFSPDDVQKSKSHYNYCHNAPDWFGLLTVALEDRSLSVINTLRARPHLWELVASSLQHVGYCFPNDVHPNQLEELLNAIPSAAHDLVQNANNSVRLAITTIYQWDPHVQAEMGWIKNELVVLDRHLSMLSNHALPSDWAKWEKMLDNDVRPEVRILLSECMPHVTAHAQAALLHASLSVPSHASVRKGLKI